MVNDPRSDFWVWSEGAQGIAIASVDGFDGFFRSTAIAMRGALSGALTTTFVASWPIACWLAQPFAGCCAGKDIKKHICDVEVHMLMIA